MTKIRDAILSKAQVNWKIPVNLLAKIRQEAQELGYGTITAFVIQVFIDRYSNKKKGE